MTIIENSDSRRVQIKAIQKFVLPSSFNSEIGSFTILKLSFVGAPLNDVSKIIFFAFIIVFTVANDKTRKAILFR